MNLSAIVSIKAAKVLQRVDTPLPDPRIVAGEQLNCLDIQADRVALAAGTHLTKRHPCAESAPPEGEQPPRPENKVARTAFSALSRCAAVRPAPVSQTGPNTTQTASTATASSITDTMTTRRR